MIEDYMTYGCITGKTSMNMKEIAQIMKEHNIGFLPITEEDKIVGILTDRDLVIGPIANGDEKIGPYLQRNIKSVEKKDSVETALKMMEENKVKRLLVRENDKVVGILSLSDLLKEENLPLLETIACIFAPQQKIREQTAEIDTFYL